MKKIKTIASKIGFSLIAVLFGVSFTAAGIGAGAIPLAKQIIGLWKAQNLVAVQAQIEKISLEEHDDETITYQVKAEFSYSYQALGHRSKRINIGGDSNDNIGDYQRDIYRELQRAKDQEQSVTLWVDPDDPEFAVYDRAIRWMRLLFLLPFASLFPAVGIGACWALWTIWRPSAEPVIPVVTAEFAQQHQVPLSSLIIAPEQSGALPMGVFAVFWNLLSWPIAGVALFSSHIGNNPLILIAAIFPLVGIGMIVFAVKLWFVRSCIGQPVLVTTRAPEIGLNEWKASIRFIPPLGERLGMLRTPQASYPIRIECQCLYEDSSGEDTSTKTLWSLVVDEVQLAHGTSQTSFMVDFPAQLPASGAADGKHKKIIWKLVVRVFDGDLVFPLLVGSALNESSKIHWQSLLHKSKPLDQLDLTKLAEAASLRNAAERRNPWLGRIFLLFFVAIAGWSLINFLLSVFGPARNEAQSEMAPVQTETSPQHFTSRPTPHLMSQSPPAPRFLYVRCVAPYSGSRHLV